MALSTSKLVADNLSASSIGGASDARLVFTSASGPGVGAWLAEARLAISPDTVRRVLFFLKGAPALIYLPGINPGNMVTRLTIAAAFQSGPHFFLACVAALRFVG